MKVTQIRRVAPTAGSSNLGGSGGIIDGGGENFGGGFPPSGQVPVATGSNTWAWASNVQLITADGSNKILSPFVNFASGSNIIFTMDVGPFPTQAFPSNTVRIHSTASGGGGGGTTITTQDEGSNLSTSVTTLNFTGAGVTASGGGATTTVNIPGGSGSDETIPAGGTLYDGTSTSGWTQFGSGGLTTFDANTTVPGALYLEKTSTGGNNDYGVYRAVGGSFPRTYTLKIKSALSYANYHGIGLMFGDSTPTAHQTWTLTHDTTYVTGLAPQRTAWTSPTSAGANTAYPGSGNPGLTPQIPFWLQVVVTSSSSVAFAASRDGYHYYTFASGINPGFTIATFGIVIFGFGIDMRGSIDWIHET